MIAGCMYYHWCPPESIKEVVSSLESGVGPWLPALAGKWSVNYNCNTWQGVDNIQQFCIHTVKRTTIMILL